MKINSIENLSEEQITSLYEEIIIYSDIITATPTKYVYALCDCKNGYRCEGASFETSADTPFCYANLGRKVLDPYGGYIGMCGNATYGTNCCGYGNSGYLYVSRCN